MNKYRIAVNNCRSWTTSASNPRTAISRALEAEDRQREQGNSLTACLRKGQSINIVMTQYPKEAE